MECLFQTAQQTWKGEERPVCSAARGSRHYPPFQSFPRAPDEKCPPSEVGGFSQLHEWAAFQVRVEASLEQAPVRPEPAAQAQVGEHPGLLRSRGAVAPEGPARGARPRLLAPEEPMPQLAE